MRTSFLTLVPALTLLSMGCHALPRPTLSDDEFASRVHSVVEKIPTDGIYELRVAAAGGHVTLAGRVDSPATAQMMVMAAAAIPGVCELSYHGLEFCPADVPDDVVVAEARKAARAAIGAAAEMLGFYCEDHFLIVYGTLPSLRTRTELDEALRNVTGVGKYHISCEVVLANPPADDLVERNVRRVFRNPLSLQNLLFKSHKIEITSSNNVVFLDGSVSTYLGRLAAEQQAAKADGVRYVVNRLLVPGTPPESTFISQMETGADTSSQLESVAGTGATLEVAGTGVTLDALIPEPTSTLNPSREDEVFVWTEKTPEP